VRRLTAWGLGWWEDGRIGVGVGLRELSCPMFEGREGKFDGGQRCARFDCIQSSSSYSCEAFFACLQQNVLLRYNLPYKSVPSVYNLASISEPSVKPFTQHPSSHAMHLTYLDLLPRPPLIRVIWDWSFQQPPTSSPVGSVGYAGWRHTQFATAALHLYMECRAAAQEVPVKH